MASTLERWALVCNPAKWAIDGFLRSGKVEDVWGIDAHAKYQNQQFGEGQLAVVRVGHDRRNKTQLNGNLPLKPGIYALCEILPRPENADPFYESELQSPVYKGSGGSDEFSYSGEVHPKGWPTVRVRYIGNYLPHPLLIDDLRREFPELDKRLLKGPRSSCIKLSGEDFRKILTLLPLPNFDDCVRTDEVREREARTLADEELRERALSASQAEPERRLTRSYYHARNGYVAAYVKRASKGFCDLCGNRAQFENDGVPYLECHHVKTLAEGGLDTVNNTVALCPNCHRRVHVLQSISDNTQLRERIEERDCGVESTFARANLPEDRFCTKEKSRSSCLRRLSISLPRSPLRPAPWHISAITDSAAPAENRRAVTPRRWWGRSSGGFR
jgi:5-methylcytosine-specific restriction endonuclease McrA